MNFNLNKNWKILKELFNRGLKENKEYKINFWSLILFDIALIISYMTFYLIYSNLVSDLIGWENFDFLFYFILLGIISKIKHIFGNKYLVSDIRSGDLNNYLTKPVNIYFFSNIIKTVNGLSFTILIFIFLIIPFLFFYDFTFNTFLLFIFVLLFSCIFEFVFSNFLFSFSFLTKSDFIWQLIQKIRNDVEIPTPKIFDNKFEFNFFMLIPSLIGSFWLVEILKGNFYVLNYFIYAVILLLLFCLGTYINWKIGLKNYEAFS